MGSFPAETARNFAEESFGLLSSVLPAAPRSARQQHEDDVEERNMRATREGFDKGRVVWFGGEGDWGRDFLFHAENAHTLLGLARGHALHPFARLDRGCYLACVLFLNLFLAAIVARDHPPVEGGGDGGVAWRRSSDYLAALAAASALNLVYDRLLRAFATCACVRPGGFAHGICCFCRECCADLGKLGLYCALFFSLSVAVYGATVAARLDSAAHFFKTFAAMKLLAWAFELAPLAFFFYRRRNAQEAYWGGDPARRAVGGPYPLGCDWPSPEFLRERRVDPDRYSAVCRERTAARAEASKRRSERASDRKSAAARLEATTRAARDRARARGVSASTREAALSVELGGVHAPGNPFRDDDDLESLGRR